MKKIRRTYTKKKPSVDLLVLKDSATVRLNKALANFKNVETRYNAINNELNLAGTELSNAREAESVFSRAARMVGV